MAGNATVVPAPPHRSHGVDHPAGREAVAAGGLGVAGGAPAEAPALGQQARAGRPVDGAVDPAAAEQAGVGRVDDGVGGQPGDVRPDSHEGRTGARHIPGAYDLDPGPGYGP